MGIELNDSCFDNEFGQFLFETQLFKNCMPWSKVLLFHCTRYDFVVDLLGISFTDILS